MFDAGPEKCPVEIFIYTSCRLVVVSSPSHRAPLKQLKAISRLQAVQIRPLMSQGPTPAVPTVASYLDLNLGVHEGRGSGNNLNKLGGNGGLALPEGSRGTGQTFNDAK